MYPQMIKKTVQTTRGRFFPNKTTLRSIHVLQVILSCNKILLHSKNETPNVNHKKQHVRKRQLSIVTRVPCSFLQTNI